MDKSRHEKSSVDMQSVLMQGTAFFQKSLVKFATRSIATAGKFLLQGIRYYRVGLPSSHQVLSSAKAKTHSFSKGQAMPPGPFTSRTRAKWSSKLLLRLDMSLELLSLTNVFLKMSLPISPSTALLSATSGNSGGGLQTPLLTNLPMYTLKTA